MKSINQSSIKQMQCCFEKSPISEALSGKICEGAYSDLWHDAGVQWKYRLPRISAKSLLCRTKQDTVQDKTRYQTLVFLYSDLQYFLCTKNVDSALGCLPTLNWLIWFENRFPLILNMHGHAESAWTFEIHVVDILTLHCTRPSLAKLIELARGHTATAWSPHPSILRSSQALLLGEKCCMWDSNTTLGTPHHFLVDWDILLEIIDFDIWQTEIIVIFITTSSLSEIR